MPPSSDNDPSLPRLLLTAGNRRFELEHDALAEVIQAGRIVAVPGGAPWLAGLAAWRGRIVTLVDAGTLFGSCPSQGPWMVVVKGLPVKVALLVDGVPRLAGGDQPGDFVLDRERLAAHEVLQPGAARPLPPVPACGSPT
jgi:chemotaxis signal transduction protein